MTNHEFAKKDPLFQEACTRAGVQPTKRQASKWRLGKGSAYSYLNEATAFLDSIEAEKAAAALASKAAMQEIKEALDGLSN